MTDNPRSSASQRHSARTMATEASVAPCILALLLTACASPPATTARIDVPDKLKPGANETLVMIVPAKGVQIYECRPRKDQTGAYEWAFVAPEAMLFDARGSQIGRHYAGPHWESNDGSRIVATVKERSDAPAANAIPWLLLDAKAVVAQGSFGKVTSIQRVNTAGGIAPAAASCSQAVTGTTARIEYTADYYFFSGR